nr:immunoglobulin heavy chain junction region [Macaca mulatta]
CARVVVVSALKYNRFDVW